MTDKTIDLYISGRLYSMLPQWHAERIKRLVGEKAIRTHAQVDAELTRLREIDGRLKVLGEHAIDLDGRRYEFKRRTADSIRQAMADGTFVYEIRDFGGWTTSQELEAERRILGVKRKRGLDDWSSWYRATDAQKAAMQVQVDEMMGRDVDPESWKFRKEPPSGSVGFTL
jgi:hypothetical protein